MSGVGANAPGTPPEPTTGPTTGHQIVVFGCYAVAAIALAMPVVIAAALADTTALAISAIGAVVLVRIIVVNVIPWLERRSLRCADRTTQP